MVNYSNGKIYKIEALNGQEGDIYIGSTTKEYLSQRMDTHRSGYNHWKKTGKKYIASFSIFEKYGIENCNIFLLETINCKTKDELRAKEEIFIKSFNCVNKVIAGRSDIRSSFSIISARESLFESSIQRDCLPPLVRTFRSASLSNLRISGLI
jgi:hypothetical protein